MLPVTEIFKSIEGEGIRTGYPSVFIRLYGCQLRCSYCDSMYSVEGGNFSYKSVEEICKEVNQFSDSIRITITGGEPLIHDEIYDLVSILSKTHEINIETNGACDLTQLFELREKLIGSNIFATMDWKSISSGVSDDMLVSNIGLLQESDVLKFVVSSVDDLIQMSELISTYQPSCNIFVSPVFGKIDPEVIVNFLISNDDKYLENIRIQLQLHKLIWDPDKRGV